VNQVRVNSTALDEPVKPLKIALLGYRSDPNSGGQGVYLYHLSKALVELGHQVDVISGEPYPELDPRVSLVKLPGLNLFQYFPKQWKAFSWRYLKSLTDTWEYASVVSGGFPEPKLFGRRLLRHFRIDERGYDVIHDNQSLCDGLVELQQNGHPVVATFHHPITRDLKLALESESRWWMRVMIRRWHHFLRMQKRVVPKLKHVYTVSEAAQKDICSDFKLSNTQLDVIYNGIDTSVFKPSQSVAKIPNRLVCTASAQSPLKGLKYLILALDLTVRENSDIHLDLISKVQPGSKIDRLIDQLKLRSHITIHSGIETTQLVTLYQRAEICVCPSLYEGFGLPAGEAMACQTAVVSSDGGALPEVVGDAGIVVPAASAEALAAAVLELLDDDQQRHRLAREGSERILRLFNWAHAAAEVVSLYERAIANADN
jgi:glycosyltransferase involved in cell wall biosynthesis